MLAFFVISPWTKCHPFTWRPRPVRSLRFYCDFGVPKILNVCSKSADVKGKKIVCVFSRMPERKLPENPLTMKIL